MADLNLVCEKLSACWECTSKWALGLYDQFLVHWPAILIATKTYGPYVLSALFTLFILLVIRKLGGYRSGRKAMPKLNRVAKPSGFNGRSIPFVNPTNAEKLGEENAASEKEVEEVTLRAQAAQRQWAKTSFEERRLVLVDLCEIILQNRDEIVRLSSTTTAMEALLGEVAVTLEKARHITNFGEEYLKTEYRHPPMMFSNRTCRIEYHPVGVIAAIVPWNYPVHNALSPVMSAIFCGNAVVVKFSEYACYCRAYMQDLVHTVLRLRGHNTDLVSFLPGYGDTGQALVESKNINKILFIGSVPVGRKIMQAAAKHLTPVILELGGKDPFVVFPDAELEFAVSVAVRGSFINLGQNCISAERTYVHKSLLPKFIAGVKELVRSMRPGFDIGCMTMEAQWKKTAELVQDALDNGAELITGGSWTAGGSEGLFFQPTVLTNIKPNMRVLKEEIFGPIMCIIPWENEEELLKEINGSEFGLCCSLISRNVKHAEKILSKIESGMGVVNEFGVPYLVQCAPFGGVKTSGFGVFNGVEGMRGFCRAQAVHSEKHWMPLFLKAPRIVSYPFLDSSPAFIRAATDLLYGWGITTKANALLRMLAALLFGSK